MLTTFLATVALAALSTYFNQNSAHPFLIVSGIIFLFLAIAACLLFSYRTEKTVLRFEYVWSYLKSGKEVQSLEFSPETGAVWWRVCKDKMNWLLVLAAFAIMLAFYRRHELQQLLQQFGLL